MMKDAVQAIIDDGLKQLEEKLERLEGAGDRAREIYERCESEIELLKELNDATGPVFIDKFAAVLVGQSPHDRVHEERLQYVSLNINGDQTTLTCVLGSDKLQGKYRFLVLLEKIE